jgi:RNA polymerase sigma-70 factor (ECF subfamily)
LDDANLISRAAQGDASAWEPVVLAHQEAVFRLAYLLLGDPDDAQDVAQETFLRAWHGLTSFDPSRSLRPWLLRIAANLANNRRRSASRYLAALMRGAQARPETVGVEEASSRKMQAEQLWQAVRRLDPSDQQVIYLRYFLDLPVAETADALGAAPGTVKSRLSRALERLRTVIRRDFPMLGDLPRS